MRFRLISVLALGAALLVTGVALAASPVKGATYKGTWGPASKHNSMIFKVSSDGTMVSNFRLSGPPANCTGTGLGSPVSRSGSISKSGAFSVTMSLVTPTKKTTGSLLMTGTFLSGGKEKGTLSTHFNSSNAKCNKIQSYTASKT